MLPSPRDMNGRQGTETDFLTRNPEELSSKQRKRQVKFLSTEVFSGWRYCGLDLVLHSASSGWSVGKAGKPKGKWSFPSCMPQAHGLADLLLVETLLLK